MRALASKLESGSIDGVLARALERAWATLAAPRLVKRLTWRGDARVVAIGGATLGGSGKTPLAIACARVLAGAGARVAIVGHAYRASPGRARFVHTTDPVAEVGDEALVCARATADLDVRVVVAPARQAALDLALLAADIVVLDGVHQTAPHPASLALLGVDPEAPWGAGACPPRGDMRAPLASLVALTDRVVAVHAESRGVWLRGALVEWSEVQKIRAGLATALARPERVLRTLAAHGVHPVALRTFSDHAARLHRAQDAARLHPARDVDLWLMTAKCAASVAHDEGVDVGIVDHRVTLAPTLTEELACLALDPHPARVLRSKKPRFS